MKLLEYEGKKLLRTYAVPIPVAQLLKNDDEKNVFSTIKLPAVVKSQVPIGGRGKLGGVGIATTAADLHEIVTRLFSLDISGFIPQTLLIEEVIAIDKEFYIAVFINRSKSCVELVAHRDGGVEIESHAGNEFLHYQLSMSTLGGIGEALAETYDLPEKAFALQDLAEKLYECFIKSDATLLEINPLILTNQGELVAGDCKMVLDDATEFRHREWNFEERSTGANFVTLDKNGTIATIANGAGLAMATVDAVTAAGHSPANFLDIGGNATTEQIIASFQCIMAFPLVDRIIINIFGGIVRCDTVARAVMEAKEKTPHLPQLIIRLSGNHSEEAAALLTQYGLKLYHDLPECIEALT